MQTEIITMTFNESPSYLCSNEVNCWSFQFDMPFKICDKKSYQSYSVRINYLLIHLLIVFIKVLRVLSVLNENYSFEVLHGISLYAWKVHCSNYCNLSDGLSQGMQELASDDNDAGTLQATTDRYTTIGMVYVSHLMA